MRLESRDISHRRVITVGVDRRIATNLSPGLEPGAERHGDHDKHQEDMDYQDDIISCVGPPSFI